MTEFGTSEESATVKAEQLESGVRISIEGPSLIVQDIRPADRGRVRVGVADFESGDHTTRWLYADRPITCWGKL